MKTITAKNKTASTERIMCHLNSSRCSRKDISVLCFFAIYHQNNFRSHHDFKMNVSPKKNYILLFYLTIIELYGNLIRISVCEKNFLNLGTNVSKICPIFGEKKSNSFQKV